MSKNTNKLMILVLLAMFLLYSSSNFDGWKSDFLIISGMIIYVFCVFLVKNNFKSKRKNRKKD